MSTKLWGIVGLVVIIALVIILLMTRNQGSDQAEKPPPTESAEQPLQTEDPMNEKTLGCDFEVAPAGDGQFSMTFNLRNPNDHPVEVRYFKPFADFDLAAEANDGPVPLVQPAYDVGVQPVNLAVDGMGGTAQITTPIRLRFDPDVAPSGGDVPTVWTLRRSPTAVNLRAILRLEGAKVEPCEARLDPTTMK